MFGNRRFLVRRWAIIIQTSYLRCFVRIKTRFLRRLVMSYKNHMAKPVLILVVLCKN